ncbi:MAG TPA: tetratricopeptide repeat protein, partial [Steroidobacteraceae bacterium]
MARVRTRTKHRRSRAGGRRPGGRLRILLGLGAVLALAQIAYGSSKGCFDRAAAGHLLSDSQWRQHGSSVERREVPRPAGDQPLLIRVEEEGLDAGVRVLGRSGTVVAQSDSPVERSSSQYLYLPASTDETTLVVTANEPAGLVGTIRVSYLALDRGWPPPGTQGCLAALQQLAAADMAYASGRSVILGHVSKPEAGGARSAFEDAAYAYKEALRALGGGHTGESGRVELALAALSYYGLKDWKESAAWAAAAAATFAENHEPYLQARAHAIEAAAWIELATKSAGSAQTIGTPRPARSQFADARALLGRLSEFHAHRHEDYDRALQINNVGLAYVYESRFEAAIPYFLRAQAEFERLGDRSRAALALQNIAMCDWGLGKLSAAIVKFDRALGLMTPSARPNLYLITLNNSGLVHYAAGQFDESLRLQTHALDLATQLQSDQARVRSDYGLGVTYYALGEHELAAEFLRRGLELSTADLDARTRVELLRALAQIEFENGRVGDAVDHDSEALRLASAPSARARILLCLAEDYAAQGDAVASRRILDALVSGPPNHDDLVRAMALARRGHLWHTEGHSQLAEADLVRGIQLLDHLDSLAERFDARVELARVYADQGRSDEAIAILRRALAQSREIRAQTTNPEYRASISRSLRPALSLQVDLLHAKYSAEVQQGRRATADDVAREALRAVDRDRALGLEIWRSEFLESHSDTELARLLSQSSALYRDMAERRYQLAVREDRGGTADPRAKALREDIARIRVRLGVITAEVARRSQAVTDDASMSNVGATLDPGQAAIEYWLGSSHAYAWVIKDGGIHWVELGATADIDRAARTLHAAMHSNVTPAARREACVRLYQLVFAPLSEVLHSTQDLTVVPDGSLHYVPFAALRDPE